jgi:hypothetical protein
MFRRDRDKDCGDCPYVTKRIVPYVRVYLRTWGNGVVSCVLKENVLHRVHRVHVYMVSVNCHRDDFVSVVVVVLVSTSSSILLVIYRA